MDSNLRSFPRWFVTSLFTLAAILACSTLLPENNAIPTEDAAIQIQRVNRVEAKAALDSGAAVFVDVRSAAAYADSHIPGAISIPLDELERRLDEFKRDQWIITYCT